MGVPFLANIQSGFFYGVNWPFLVWLEPPKAVAASIVLHVFLAGFFTYLFARCALRLSFWGAITAAVLFALGGAVLVGGALALFHGSLVLAPLGLLGGLVGFFDPDQEVADAAEKRKRQIVLEMGYKVPELRVYVRSGRTFVSALRYLTSRPGGPFVKELHRALAVYDITADLERGLRAVIDHNPLCEPLVYLCADLLAVLSEGGELGPVLEAHAETALHEQQQLLIRQGQENTQAMTYLVSFTTMMVLALLVGAPALWTIVISLGGL